MIPIIINKVKIFKKGNSILNAIQSFLYNSKNKKSHNKFIFLKIKKLEKKYLLI